MCVHMCIMNLHVHSMQIHDTHIYTHILNKRWGLLEKFLRQMVAHVKAQAIIYKVVVQTLLLYGCEV